FVAGSIRLTKPRRTGGLLPPAKAENSTRRLATQIAPSPTASAVGLGAPRPAFWAIGIRATIAPVAVRIRTTSALPMAQTAPPPTATPDPAPTPPAPTGLTRTVRRTRPVDRSSRKT